MVLVLANRLSPRVKANAAGWCLFGADLTLSPQPNPKLPTPALCGCESKLPKALSRIFLFLYLQEEKKKAEADLRRKAV